MRRRGKPSTVKADLDARADALAPAPKRRRVHYKAGTTRGLFGVDGLARNRLARFFAKSFLSSQSTASRADRTVLKRLEKRL